MKVTSAIVLVSAIILAVCACSSEPAVEREAAMRAARADSVLMAEAKFDQGVFDTLTFENPEARYERGRVVWRASCQKCHGVSFTGDGEFAKRYEMVVPSFLVADWPYRGDIDALRHRVFVGHDGEMPNWGLHGLKYRDVDAVAAYIQYETGGPISNE